MGAVNDPPREPFKDSTPEFSQNVDPGLDFAQAALESESIIRASRDGSEPIVRRKSGSGVGFARVGQVNPEGDRAVPALASLKSIRSETINVYFCKST